MNSPVQRVVVTKTIVRQTPEHQLCVICMSNPADHIITACGHQCGCEECLATLKNGRNGKCPVCRTRVGAIQKVFRSGIDDDEENNQEQGEVVVERIELGLNANSEDGAIPMELENNGWGDAGLGNELDAVAAFERSISDSLKINVAPCEEIPNSGKDNAEIAVTVGIPDLELLNERGLTNRTPVDVCCVIDVSGSMGTDATYQDPNDETKTLCDGFTILDIVKHAVKTVIHTLTDQDRLSLAVFNNQAKTVLKRRHKHLGWAGNWFEHSEISGTNCSRWCNASKEERILADGRSSRYKTSNGRANGVQKLFRKQSWTELSSSHVWIWI